jgi:hypothetical protein
VEGNVQDRTQSRRRALIAIGVATALASIAALIMSASAGAVTSHFSSPSSLADIGSDLFVANAGNGTVTELNASTGSVLSTFSKTVVSTASPQSIVADGGDLFVSGTSGAVVELTPDGKLVHKVAISGCTGGASKLGVESAGAIVELCKNGEISQLSVPGLTLTKQISPAAAGLSDATALTVVGTSAYVTSVTAAHAHDGVVVVSLTTGKKTASVTDANEAQDDFAAPAGIASNGTDLWVTNAGTTSVVPSVTELTRSNLALVANDDDNWEIGTTGAVIAVPTATAGTTDVYVATVNGTTSSMMTLFISSASDHFSYQWMWCNSNPPETWQFGDPSAMAVHSGVLWVANASTNVLDEMDSQSGDLNQTIS